MNDRELEHLLHRAQPHLAGVVGSAAFDRAEQELLEEIMSTIPSDSAPVDDRLAQLEIAAPPAIADRSADRFAGRSTARSNSRSTGRSTGRQTLVAVAAAAALVAAIAGPTVYFGRGPADVLPGSPPVAAAPAANDNPHLLLDDPAWKLTYVLESNAVSGEMQWSKGRDPMQLNWYQADLRQSYYDDRRLGAAPTKIRVLGQEADLFDTGQGSFEVILPAEGNIFVMIAGRADGRAGFETLLAELRRVPAATWYAAAPGSVVTPDESAEVARAMLADVPLAPGYDPSTLPLGLTQNYYDYGATVIGGAACAWLNSYETARTSKDEAGVARAQAALRSSGRWKVVRRMAKEGDWPWVLSQFTGRVAQGEPAGHYQQALGC